jgi:hypothetical protein
MGLENCQWNQIQDTFPSLEKAPSFLRKKLIDEIGPTTAPERTDVLIGTRLHSEYLGSLSQWMDFHPGNIEYNEEVAAWSYIFSNYKALPAPFQNSVGDRILETVRGRLLRQNWATGSWVIMDDDERMHQLHMDMLVDAYPTLFHLGKTLDILLARSRFDVSHRETSLGFASQVQIRELKHSLFKKSKSAFSETTLLVLLKAYAGSIQGSTPSPSQTSGINRYH